MSPIPTVTLSESRCFLSGEVEEEVGKQAEGVKHVPCDAFMQEWGLDTPRLDFVEPPLCRGDSGRHCFEGQ
jgi:hypothetical protein